MSDPRPEPKWARVLKILYDRDKRLSVPFDSNEQKVKHISSRLGRNFNKSEVENTLRYLDDVGLVSGYKQAGEIFQLAEKGFDVAHERELDRAQARREDAQNQRSDKINGTVAGLTLVLVLTALAQTLTSVAAIFQNNTQRILEMLSLLIILFAILTAIWVILHPVDWRAQLTRSN